MTRWVRGIIWVTGTCVLTCPLCVCLSGGGAWWVCACTVGLISVTMLSGYGTWNVISQILNGSCLNNNLLKRCKFLTFQIEDNNLEKTRESVSYCFDESVLEREISITAQTFHSNLVLPWYSFISPDDKYSLQIRSTLEDLLTGIFKNLRQHTKISSLVQNILVLYIQHYRQFYKALRKVSQKLKKRPVDCLSQEDELKNFYKPIHAALKTENGVVLHCRRLAHLLLINYLPSEITKCDLVFIGLRDLFAQNLLQAVLDVFCDTEWLNNAVLNVLSQAKGLNAKDKQHSDAEDGAKCSSSMSQSPPTESREDKAFSYTHSLSAIREETSLEVLDTEISWGDSTKAPSFPKKYSGTLTKRGPGGSSRRGSTVPQKVQIGLGKNESSSSDREGKIGNTQALLTYIQSSSLDKESKVESKRSVATALGDLISTTTVPLLPEAASFPSIPSKMWESPLDEERDVISEIKPVGKKNIFRKIIVEGLTEMDYKELHEKMRKEVAKEEVVRKCGSSVDRVLLSPGTSKRKGSEGEFSNLQELQRSRSLNSLPSKDGKGEEGDAASWKLSSSNENIPRAWCSLDDSCVGGKRGSSVGGKKNKGLLQKMDSFDKNDGDDAYSLPSSSTTVSMSASKEDSKRVSISPSSPSSSTSTLAPGELVEKASPNALDLPLSPVGEAPVGFGWENPDLSPIYEESENLASTIAKLRCLLSERQSQHSLGSQSSFGSSESEPKSAQSDPGRYSLEKSRFTFYHKDSSGSLASVKSTSSSDSIQLHATTEEEPLEAAEVPIDGKVFVSVSIPTTEVHSETAGFQYTMYIIQYDAIYLCEIFPASCGEGGSEGVQASDHKMVLQTNFVKRRFREFLSLHSALEDDPTLRPAMKGIKGPNKWLNLPFSKLDSATISSRKQFLEKYLQSLIQRPVINTCPALKDFLAYGLDSSIAFVKKPLEINVPRLDKLLARTVSGVFHSIKTALPNFDSPEVPIGGNPPPAGAGSTSGSQASRSGGAGGSDATLVRGGSSQDKERQSGFLEVQGDFEVQLDITAEEQVCEMEGTLLSAITSSTSSLSSPIEVGVEAPLEFHSNSGVSFHPRNQSPFPNSVGLREPENLPAPVNPLASFWTEIGLTTSPVSPLRRQESQDSVVGGEIDLEKNCPLFLTLVDVVVEIVGATDHPLTRQGAITLITRLWARPFSYYIQTQLDRLVSEELVEEFFTRLRLCLAEPEATPPPSPSENPAQQSKERLWNTLESFLPSVVELMLGKEATRESLSLFVESLQHPSLNRDLGLHLIDIIFVHLLLPV